MHKKSFTKLLALTLSAAVTLSLAACNAGKTNESAHADELAGAIVEVTEVPQTEIGEGETRFSFEIVDVNGASSFYLVSTDETMVGAALLEVGLIAGEESEYGLYVKTVAGTTLDYVKDGKYWAFYVDDEYAVSGVDTTEIDPSSVYSFRAESA